MKIIINLIYIISLFITIGNISQGLYISAAISGSIGFIFGLVVFTGIMKEHEEIQE